MPRQKAIRNTTYRHRYNALSALEVHTIGKIQHLWTLWAMQLKVAEWLFAFSVVLELDDNEEFLMMMMMMMMMFKIYTHVAFFLMLWIK